MGWVGMAQKRPVQKRCRTQFEARLVPRRVPKRCAVESKGPSSVMTELFSALLAHAVNGFLQRVPLVCSIQFPHHTLPGAGEDGSAGMDCAGARATCHRSGSKSSSCALGVLGS